MELILSSQSPRRRELLRQMDLDFTIADPYFTDESFSEDILHRTIPEILALRKADSYPHQLTNEQILITADTLVLHDGKLLGKPNNTDEAVDMLTRLSGSWHEVITAVCLRSKSKKVVFSESSGVEFATLSYADIHYYISKYQPFDKAGAYGIQEWIACVGIKGIRGCYYNIMGLPLYRLNSELKKFETSANNSEI